MYDSPNSLPTYSLVTTFSLRTRARSVWQARSGGCPGDLLGAALSLGLSLDRRLGVLAHLFGVHESPGDAGGAGVAARKSAEPRLAPQAGEAAE